MLARPVLNGSGPSRPVLGKILAGRGTNLIFWTGAGAARARPCWPGSGSNQSARLSGRPVGKLGLPGTRGYAQISNRTVRT